MDEHFALDGRIIGVRPGHRLRLRAAWSRRGRSPPPGGGEVAIATARCDRRLTARYGPADDVAVELRGAGPATRQVNNFLSPEAWPHADKLMCVELLTPDGNWSSYPPHRHDDSPECPVNNEEIYYFRIGVAGTQRLLHRRLRHAPHLHARWLDRRERRRSTTATCSACPAATTARASPRPATRCTTSTCSPGRAASDRWRSATTRPITGSATPGPTWPPIHGAR